MKYFTIILAVVASSLTAAAQQPTRPGTRPAPSILGTLARPAIRDTIVQLDRIVAVVGDQPITQYDLQERILALQQAPNFKPPTNEAEFRRLSLDVINQLVDEAVLVEKANQLKVEIADNELSTSVDKQIRDIRARFSSDAEFRAELQKAGLGSPEEYRRFLTDQLRRTELQRRVITKMREEGKIPPVNVTQSEVEDAYNKAKGQLPKRPATVTFRQIVIAPKAGETQRNAAKAKVEALIAEIKAGGDFERIARRESMDSASRETGGDLGWNRRGVMVPEFERWMFGMRPGDLSPPVETPFGFHVIRVDRVQPGEVKARHILIRPSLDSTDDVRARIEADSVAALWRSGAVSFDSLARRHHDFGSGEETSLLTPMTRDSMPASYQAAFAGKKANDIMVFPIAGPSGHPKFVVAQVLSSVEGGEYTLADMRERIRQQLVEEGSIRRFLDTLRKETYVSIRVDSPVVSSEPR